MGGVPNARAPGGRPTVTAAELSAITRNVKQAVEHGVDQQKAMDRMYEVEARYTFFTTLTTRIGLLVILVYAATFLVNGYRYALRLAAAYDARADAIELEWDDKDLARRFMSVDDFAFDRTKAPTQEALEIAMRILNETKKEKA
jgi:hypothetical protein